MNDNLGKDAEKKIHEWLDHPEDGKCFDRIPDQMTGFYGSRNICDFTFFQSPYYWYIESKATWEDRFDFSMISDYQWDNMLKKSKIKDVFAVVIVLFASYKRAFLFHISDIDEAYRAGTKSLNIKKIDKWKVPYKEIQTLFNNRKKLPDYTGELLDYTLDTNATGGT